MNGRSSLMPAFINIAVGLLILVSCTKAKDPIEQSLYDVSITNGSVSGAYVAQSTMHIWADLSNQEEVFNEWVGDSDVLTDPRSAHTTFVMPAWDVSFTATYTAVPAWNATKENIAGHETYHYFPEDITGVITFYHGSGGSASEWTETSIERRLFVRDAIAEGYGIIAIDSGDRVQKEWDISKEPKDNLDVQAVQMILKTFIARGLMKADTPVYGIGISQGGRFVSLVAYELGFKAVAIYCGTSEQWVIEVTTVPTIWCLAERDAIIENEEQPVPLHHILEDRWVDTALYVNPSTPLYPLRFSRLQGLSTDDSLKVFSELKTNGYLNQDNYLINNPRLSGWEKHVAQDYSDEARRAIREELFATFAEHEFFSDCNRKVLNFFRMHR